jgi:hypothetical protein
LWIEYATGKRGSAHRRGWNAPEIDSETSLMGLICSADADIGSSQPQGFALTQHCLWDDFALKYKYSLSASIVYPQLKYYDSSIFDDGIKFFLLPLKFS